MRMIWIAVVLSVAGCGGGGPDGADEVVICTAPGPFANGPGQTRSCAAVCNELGDGVRESAPAAACSTSCGDGHLGCSDGAMYDLTDGGAITVDGDHGCCLEDLDGVVHWCGCD